MVTFVGDFSSLIFFGAAKAKEAEEKRQAQRSKKKA